MSTIQSQVFTASGTFNVPAGVSLVWVDAIGAGAPGGPAVMHDTGSIFAYSMSGGGAGGVCFGFPRAVTPGGTLAITVGDGGEAKTSPVSYSDTSGRGLPSVIGGVEIAGGGWGPFWRPPLFRPAGYGGYAGPGGGAGGGGGPTINSDGEPGTRGGVAHWGGAGGAAQYNGAVLPGGTVAASSNVDYLAGGACGAVGGVGQGAGGGGASFFADGGAGGTPTFSGGVPGYGNDGEGFGAGGGGAGQTTVFSWNSTTPQGGDGIDGRVVVYWVS